MPFEEKTCVAKSPICHSTLYAAIRMRYHTVSRPNRLEVAK